ncbi:MAG: tetratricopeptide repeat protein [Cyanobacteria bacterium J06560_6]
MAKSGRKQNAANGFGKPTSVSTREATQFMRAVRQTITAAKGDKEKVYRFFEANLDKLDESLVEALPSVFSKVTSRERQGKQEKIAELFVDFAVLVQKFPLGNRAINLELAIAAYQIALRLFCRDEFPENWSVIQNNLGVAYGNRIQGERAENIEKAIAAYELALQIRTREAFPENWAMTQNNLGNAYGERIRDKRAENIEKAITAYERALQISTRETFPKDWAGAQNNLGNVYRNRIRGKRVENIEKAIASYELALQIRTREAFPEDWAITQNNLGVAYGERIRGERAENIERAIAAYKLALQIRTREAFPENWAMTQNNLGNAYGNRIQGERSENIEKAIAAYELALQVRTREAFPEDWADTQGSLANVYRDRIQGNQAQNIEKAISLHDQAAEVFTRKSFPNKWAENQSKLAKALMKKALSIGTSADLDTAVSLLQEAIDVATPNSPHWIDAQYQLGNALYRRYESSQTPQDLEQALQAYKIALDAISPEHYDRRQIWQALPTTQSILGSRLIRDGEWQEGLQLLLNSVSQLSAGDDPLAHANALYETGKAYDALSDWDNARTTFRDALRLYKYLEDPLGMAKSRAELGSVLVFQGYTEKGFAELAKAKEEYAHLQQPERLAEVNVLYKATQKLLAEQNAKAYA